MSAENAINKWSLDLSIFSKTSFPEGHSDMLFGEIGKITRVGNIYSFNQGFDMDFSGEYTLVVLDTEAKTLDIYAFRNNIDKHSWEKIKSSTDPQIEGNPDYIYSLVEQFAKKAFEFSETNNNKVEGSQMKLALKKATKPLRRYLNKVRRQAGIKIKDISF